MNKPKVGTNNLQKLLMIDDHEIKLDSSFQSSGPTSLPDGDNTLNLCYENRPEVEAEEFMGDESRRIYDIVNEIGLRDRINVYGNNVKQKVVDGTQMYTPHVAIVGDLEIVGNLELEDYSWKFRGKL